MADATIRMDLTISQKRALDALNKLAGGVKQMTAEQKKAVKDAKVLEKTMVKAGREAKKVFEQSKTGAQRYREQLRMLNTAGARNVLTEKQRAQAIRFVKTEYQQAGAAGQRAFGPNALSMVRGMAASLGMGAGVAGAVMKITEGYGNWLSIAREISAETRKAAIELIEFAALQEGGTKRARVMEAMDLGIRYGITDRGVAWDVVQSMQSAAGGDFQQGMKRAEVIFAAKRVGIPVPVGQSVERYGAGQQMPPGQAIRMAEVAGRLSSLTAEPLAKTGQALSYWEDPAVMFGAAAVLSEFLEPGKLEVHVRRAAMTLSGTGKLQPYFEKAGLGKAGPLERVRHLREKEGIVDADTLQALANREEIGIIDVRAKKAISDLALGLADWESAVKVIRKEAVPGLIIGKIKEIEAELPTTKLTRQLEMAEAMFAGERAFDPEAQELELRQRARGIAADRLGFRQTALGKPMIEEGRVSGGRQLRAWIEGIIADTAIRTMGPISLIPGMAERVERGLEDAGYPGTGLEELKKLNALTEEVLNEIRTGNEKLDKPPALSLPGVKDVNNTQDPNDN